MRKVRENDCCGYKEKLAREKLRGNRRSRTGSVKKKKNVTPANCCYKGVDNNAAELEQKAKIAKCLGLKKKSKEIKKRQQRLQIDCGQLLSVIKPTYYDRERYANFQHLLCILDEEETVKWIKLTELREKWRKNLEFYQCGQKSEDTGAKKKETKASQKEDQGVNGNEAEGEGCKRKNTCTVGGKKGKQVEQDRREAESTKMAKRECDSICSFDSEIDLTGLALTKEEISKIEKNRKQPGENDDNAEECIEEDAKEGAEEVAEEGAE